MIGWGGVAGVIFVILDEILGAAGRMRLPPLAVGIGVYLPMSLMLPVSTGALIGWFYDRWAEKRRDSEFALRMGVLTATGMIVGESLWGVVFAGIVAGSGRSDALALTGGGFEFGALLFGLVLFAGLLTFLYRRTRRLVVSE